MGAFLGAHSPIPKVLVQAVDPSGEPNQGSITGPAWRAGKRKPPLWAPEPFTSPSTAFCLPRSRALCWMSEWRSKGTNGSAPRCPAPSLCLPILLPGYSLPVVPLSLLPCTAWLGPLSHRVEPAGVPWALWAYRSRPLDSGLPDSSGHAGSEPSLPSTAWPGLPGFAAFCLGSRMAGSGQPGSWGLPGPGPPSPLGKSLQPAVFLLQPVASRASPWEGPWASAGVSFVSVPSPSFPESPATALGPWLIRSEWPRGTGSSLDCLSHELSLKPRVGTALPKLHVLQLCVFVEGGICA